ncbi:hypothetical protein AB833_15815 [Chromatiales bacterium (ex Bugula neritina AB1)]|nr:hypothetical protein AB833_15815 [Chromatiales bacterium (ex Bugula neritina AB1)]
MLADLLQEILDSESEQSLLARANALGLELAPGQRLASEPEESGGSETRPPPPTIEPPQVGESGEFSFNIARIVNRQQLVVHDTESALSGYQALDPESPQVQQDNRPIRCRAEPLLDQRRLQLALEQSLVASHSGNRLDAKRLSQRLARQESPAPLPRREYPAPRSLSLVLIDECQPLLSDQLALCHMLQALPAAIRPELIARAIHHPQTGWLSGNHKDLPVYLLQRHYAAAGGAVLIVGDPANPGVVLLSLLARLQLRISDCLWLSPVAHPLAILWDLPATSRAKDNALVWLLALLASCPVITSYMVRRLRRLLGAGMEVELAFYAHNSVQWYESANWGRVVEQRLEYSEKLKQFAQQHPQRMDRCIDELWKSIEDHPRFYRLEASIAWRNAAVEWAGQPHIADDIEALDEYLGQIGKSLQTGAIGGIEYASCILQLSARNKDSTEYPELLHSVVQLAQRQWLEYYPDSMPMEGSNPTAGQQNPVAAQLFFDGHKLLLDDPASHKGVVLCDLLVAPAGLVIEINNARAVLSHGESLQVDAAQKIAVFDAEHRIDIEILDETELCWASAVDQRTAAQVFATADGDILDNTIEGLRVRQEGQLPSDSQLQIDEYGLSNEVVLFGVPLRFRYIPPGDFVLGSPEDEPEREDNEQQHTVSLTNGFWLADTACSQRLWQAVTGKNPSHFKGDDLPVEQISWEDVQGFCERLNANRAASGLPYRLPTEAEWEYACRAGTQTVFSWGNELSVELANYNGHYPYNDGEKGIFRQRTVDVRTFDANPWGLYQMHGNVYEWCQDFYGDYPEGDVIDPKGADAGDDRVLRGGSWIGSGGRLRSANRDANAPGDRNFHIGFRLAQSARPESKPAKKEKRASRR